MATINPYDDPEIGVVWETGYLAGYGEPEVDHLRPFSSELLDVYLQGEQAGRDDRRQSPPDQEELPEPTEWNRFTNMTIGVAELGIKALAKRVTLKYIFKGLSGLVSLLTIVVPIPADVRLKPLEPDWEGPPDDPGDTFCAVCPRTDHEMVSSSVTPEGFWVGPARTNYTDAVYDLVAHEHPEAGIALCNLSNETCGLVGPP